MAETPAATAPADPALAAATPAASAEAAAAAASAAAPAAPAPAAAAPAELAAPAAEAPKPAEGAPLAAAPAAEKPAKEFAPSILDEAAKPTAEPLKPGEAAPAKDAAKPAEAKPSDKKEPAAAEAKPGEKPGEAKPAEPPAPIEYKFTLPETIKPEDVNPERMNAFTGILQEVRAAPESAQKLLNLHLDEVTRIAHEVEQRVSERQWDVFAEQQRKSRDEVMADPVLGGSRHDTAIRTVMSVLDAYGLRDQTSSNPRSADAIAAERKQLLDDFRATGIANRASFLRLLNWAGETFVKEGRARPAMPPRAPNPSAQQRGVNRYRNTTPASNGAG
jgi:hypothetical protein